MDTIQLDLIFRRDIDFTKDEEKKISRRLEGLMSPIDYTYCDVLKDINYDREVKVIVKLSYPRFYFGNNAYLVESSQECRKVQEYFVEQLQKDELLKNIEKIRVTRVDIPFTYTMHESKEFSDYSNVYRILGLVFIKRYPKVRPKAIIDLISNKKETITYTDTRIPSAYNKKIMIYNQYINLKDKLDEGEFDRTIKEFPDLENRMRIEVSRRIVIRDMELDIFRAYSLFDRYLNEFKKDLRKTIFNLELLDEVYKEESEVLASKLEEYKESKGSAFTYETFILKEIDNIYDYKILREGIGLITPNEKTKENAITIIRKILRGVEEENGKIILDVRKIIKEIHETIEDSFYNKRNSRKERIDVF